MQDVKIPTFDSKSAIYFEQLEVGEQYVDKYGFWEKTKNNSKWSGGESKCIVHNSCISDPGWVAAGIRKNKLVNPLND